MTMRYQFPAQNLNVSAGSLSSMIDIIFLLIIFFVVTASIDREQLDSKVTLPAVDSAAVKSLPQQRLVLNVFADGTVRAGFHELSAAEVRDKLGGILHALNSDQNTVLIINGDRETPHRYIATVLDAIAEAGYAQVRINAEVKKEGH